jgi:hypothetical protein
MYFAQFRQRFVYAWLRHSRSIFLLAGADFYQVTEVWIKHWWRVPSMAWFREVYCAPGTAGSKCMVPILHDNSTYTELDWCIENYNATDCTNIRKAAQEEVYDLMSWFYNSSVAWGFALIMVVSVLNETGFSVSVPTGF